MVFWEFRRLFELALLGEVREVREVEGEAGSNSEHQERQQGRAVSESLRAISATRDQGPDNSDSWRAAAWLLSHGTARDRYGDRAEPGEALTVSGLFAALTAASQEPPRLGAADAVVDALPLLEEHAPDASEEHARDVELNIRGSSNRKQKQEAAVAGRDSGKQE